MPSIGGQVPQRQDTPPARIGKPGCPVHGQEVEEDRVAGLESEGVKWAREILQHSPLAIRCLKSAFNADVDGQSGVQELAGNATLLYYMTDEAKEFHRAQREKRKPDAAKFAWLP